MEAAISNAPINQFLPPNSSAGAPCCVGAAHLADCAGGASAAQRVWKDIKSYQETKGFAEQSQPCTSFFPNFSWGQLDRGRAMVGKLSWCAHREQGCSWPRWGCELCFNTTQTPRAKRSLKVTQEMTKRERKQRSEGARPKKKGLPSYSSHVAAGSLRRRALQEARPKCHRPHRARCRPEGTETPRRGRSPPSGSSAC